MPRPVKLRKIAYKPESIQFIPTGIQKCEIEEIEIKFEEIEAMRLKDIEEYSQEECAIQMNVSRQTFQLIIDKARKKVAEALVTGKAIRIIGGDYVVENRIKICHCGKNASKPKHCRCPNCHRTS